MATTRQHLAALRKACELRSQADFERYSESIAALRERPSPEVLAGMLRCLRDVEGGEVQYELVEACEAYDAETYARGFAAAAAELRAVAPHWGGLMFQSVLNSDRSRKSLASPPSSAPRRRTSSRRVARGRSRSRPATSLETSTNGSPAASRLHANQPLQRTGRACRSV
jgi:hypothetical protein